MEEDLLPIIIQAMEKVEREVIDKSTKNYECLILIKQVLGQEQYTKHEDAILILIESIIHLSKTKVAINLKKKFCFKFY